MRRALAPLCALCALALAPVAASAHPLGNFSINHLTRVTIARDAIRLHWTLDQAEIPTFQERGLSNAAVLARKVNAARTGLSVRLNGRRLALTPLPGAGLSHPPGQGGLPLTRVVLDLIARAHVRGRVAVRDETFPGRIGWKAIVARPGRGTAVRSTAPSTDPTGDLRAYPKDALQSPADLRAATFTVRPGAGTLIAPRGPDAGAPTTRNRSGDGLAAVFSSAAAGQGALVFLLLAACGWGAVHALSPGHGKTLVAAYLVGTKGRPRHALALGATVTVTHTAGVFALGLVTLALSAYVVPERLYPWLNLASGVLVLVIGAGVLRARLRNRARAHAHRHHHHAPEEISWRGILGMGASAGLLPCPSALVVLLAGIAQHQVVLGLIMICAFSLGLAGTLTGLGLIVVWTRGLAGRLSAARPLTAVLPAASALVILGAGCVLTAQALGRLPV
jgi:nickel/cobalt transporter (NicO) family protein